MRANNVPRITVLLLGCLGVWLPGARASDPPLPDDLGACCWENGVCEVMTYCECLGQPDVFTWLPDTICEPDNPCPQCVCGACCMEEDCMIVAQPDCDDLGGEWMGAWVDCTPNPCSTPSEEDTWGQIKSVFQ